jgi:Domain of unknown function (DUF5668)
MGPAVLITVGVLFLLHEVRSDTFNFWDTYPFILIVIGAVLLASSAAPMTGHVDSTAPPPPAAQPSAPGSAQNPVPGQGQ